MPYLFLLGICLSDGFPPGSLVKRLPPRKKPTFYYLFFHYILNEILCQFNITKFRQFHTVFVLKPAVFLSRRRLLFPRKTPKFSKKQPLNEKIGDNRLIARLLHRDCVFCRLSEQNSSARRFISFRQSTKKSNRGKISDRKTGFSRSESGISGHSTQSGTPSPIFIGVSRLNFPFSVDYFLRVSYTENEKSPDR